MEIPADAGGREYSVTIYNYRKTQTPGTKYDAADHTALSDSLVLVFRNAADAVRMREILTEDYNEAVAYTEGTTAKYRLRIDDVLTADRTALTETAQSWKLDNGEPLEIDQWSISDGEGHYSFADLVPGETYYIIEVVAPNGFNLDRDANGNYAIHPVVVSNPYNAGAPFASVDGDEDTHELAIANVKYYRIHLDKVTEISGMEYHLSNATFTIYGSTTDGQGNVFPDTSNVIGNMVYSNDSGMYSSNYLPEGTYFIAETAFPEGFEQAERPALTAEELAAYGEAASTGNEGNSYDYVDVTTQNADGTATTVRYYKVVLGRDTDNTWFQTHPIYNTATYGRFAITKVDSVTDKTVAAVFSVEKHNEETGEFETYEAYPTISTNTTDSYTYSNFLPAGIYRLTETSVTGNYTKGEPVYIQVASNQVTDGSKPGEITYRNAEKQDVKVDGYLAATGNVGATDGELTTPIVIENDPQGRFWIYKTGTWNGGADAGGTTEPLAGVTFDVYKKVSNDFANDSAEGQGNYIDTLTTGSDGYVQSGWLDAGEYWVVETGVGESNAANYGKDSYTAQVVTVYVGITDQTAVVGENTINNTLSVENTHNLGKFQVTKVDSVDTDTKLSGAVFEIYNNADCSDTAVGRMVDNGDGTYISPFLTPGNYWLKEVTTPANYTQNQGTIFGGEGGFTVTANGLNVVESALANDLDNSLTVVKYQQIGDETTENPLSGAYFALYTDRNAAATATLGSDGKATNNPEREGTTNDSGTLVWNGLPNDTYYLVELRAPQGHIRNETVFEIELDNTDPGADGQRIAAYSQTVYNIRLGGFTLEKTISWDGGKIAREGISFTLYDAASTQLAVLTTDENGEISYQLPAGEYTLVENDSEVYSMDEDQLGTGDELNGNYIVSAD